MSEWTHRNEVLVVHCQLSGENGGGGREEGKNGGEGGRSEKGEVIK